MLIIFGNRHFIKSLIENFQLIDDKIMRKYKSLIIVPHLIHIFDKIVRIVPLYDIIDSGLHIKLNKLSNIETYALIEMCTLLDRRFWVGKVINVTKKYHKRMYSRSDLWLSITSALFSTSLNISYLLNCYNFPVNVLTR